MEITTLDQQNAAYPQRLLTISSPPQKLFVRGANLDDLLIRPAVAIVGSRRITPYGRQVTYNLARELAEQGVVIISGLAIGVDSEAHRAALSVGGLTLAVLPRSLTNIYPATNSQLAQQIIDSGGALVSEYEYDDFAYKSNFVARNRIVTGLANVLVITEATEKSGSLHTAAFAMDHGQTVMAVPGPITSPNSAGTNNLLKSSVIPVTSIIDVLHALQVVPHGTKLLQVRGRNRNEQTVLDLLLTGIRDGNELLAASLLSTSQFNQVLTMLEISNKIRALGANQWAIT
jgi:DNA processing protein